MMQIYISKEKIGQKYEVIKFVEHSISSHDLVIKKKKYELSVQVLEITLSDLQLYVHI
jgi:hypothetical protein